MALKIDPSERPKPETGFAVPSKPQGRRPWHTPGFSTLEVDATEGGGGGGGGGNHCWNSWNKCS